MLVVDPNQYGLSNIGDYIQAVAARQFIGHNCRYIERDRGLKVYDGPPVKMIMNGWFMDYGENFPPSDKITPLYVAFHINKLGLPGLLSPEAIEHYKKHQPIGCRDRHTADLLRQHGVEAYFSGCLTLTLGLRYKAPVHDGKVYVVDPCFSTRDLSRRPLFLTKALFNLVRHYRSVKTITDKRCQSGMRALLHNAIYFAAYSKAFDPAMLVEAEYVCHYDTKIPIDHPTYSSRMDYAESLVRRYARARLVITSRIHCALPCTALETPCVYIRFRNESPISSDRYGGLITLLNVFMWCKDGIDLPRNAQRISLTNLPPLRDEWKSYADALIARCRTFVTGDNGNGTEQSV